MSVSQSLARDLLNRIQSLLEAAEQEQKPLEIDPWRERLFELFVTADGAELLNEGGEADLTADALCRQLAERWGLADATRDAFSQQSKLPPDQLAKMRLLWSLMRMWMEWQYAWDRWPEFHVD